MPAEVLYINHKFQKCGVYEFGKAIGACLENSVQYKFQYCECDSWKEFLSVFKHYKPQVVIYNYHPLTLSWIKKKNVFKKFKLHRLNAVHVGTIHEVYQELANTINNSFFNYYIAADPTLITNNPIVFTTGRLVAYYQNNFSAPATVTVGSFGFATSNKGFEKIIAKVQEDFNEAIININISYSKYIDANGDAAKKVAQQLQSKVYKPGITLNVTHRHLTIKELQEFLAKNSINVFLYEYQEKRGVSSTIDWALSVRRPIAITKSSMFRHLHNCDPSICVEDNSLKCILNNGIKPLEKYIQQWSPENLLSDYEKIVSKVLNNKSLK